MPPNSSEASTIEPALPATPGEAGKPRSLWYNRDFLLLWSGQMLSSVGTQVSALAYPLLVLFLTGSPVQAGIVGGLQSLPFLFLSLPVGALLDRWDRKRVMILADSGRALSLFSVGLVYTLFGTVPLFQFYITALVEGILFVFFNLAQVACLPRVASKEQLPAATGMYQTLDGASVLVGPPLGGVLYGLGRMLPFFTDAFSYVFSVGSLLLIRTSFQEERSARTRNLRAEIAEGLRWMWHQPIVRFTALMGSILNFLGAGFGLIIIVLAQHQGASSSTIGVIFAIGSVGVILGSLLAPLIQKRWSFGRVVITFIWINALIWPLYALASTPLLLGVLSAAYFLIGPIFNVVVMSYRLSLIPDALQGRVNSAVRVFAYGLIPVGQAVTGLLLQQIGPIATILLLAVGFVVLALMITLNPDIRHASRPGDNPPAQPEVSIEAE
ncbi:MAG TPA: MFS transporter [Ktedonobacterales bacterium]|jgi:MFS family permease